MFIGQVLLLIEAVPRDGPCQSHRSAEGHRRPSSRVKSSPGLPAGGVGLQPSAPLAVTDRDVIGTGLVS